MPFSIPQLPSSLHLRQGLKRVTSEPPRIPPDAAWGHRSGTPWCSQQYSKIWAPYNRDLQYANFMELNPIYQHGKSNNKPPPFLIPAIHNHINNMSTIANRRDVALGLSCYPHILLVQSLEYSIYSGIKFLFVIYAKFQTFAAVTIYFDHPNAPPSHKY